jgi:LPS export ABC transporter protein LptC
MVPAMGGGLLLLFFLWPVITQIRLPKLDKAQISGDRTELVNPEYEGQDEGGQRYRLTAQRAIQTRAVPDVVTLIAPTAELVTGQNAGGTTITAVEGQFDNKAQQLGLVGDVSLRTENGESFTTPAAAVDLQNKIVQGTDAITGTGPQFDLEAAGFVYDQKGGTLTLSGPLKLVLKETDETPSSAAMPLGH